MSTQKAKFALFSRLRDLGFTYDEAASLRRIEMTLSRWSEAECGDAQGRCIERDPQTEKPFVTYERANGERSKPFPIADREAGALRRLKSILAARNARHPVKGNYVDPQDPRAGMHLEFYHQTDPRGCALYLLRPGDVPPGKDAAAFYSNGLAVCC